MADFTEKGTGNAVEIVSGQGHGAAVIVCDHASDRIPARYGDLGLDATARQTHAAREPGAAPLVAGRISRLVHGRNRPSGHPSAVPAQADTREVTGNAGLTAAKRAARARAAHAPFAKARAGVIARRQALGTPCGVVTVHSISPEWLGTLRAHGLAKGLPHVMPALRTDLLASAAARDRVADEVPRPRVPAWATRGLQEAHHA